MGIANDAQDNKAGPLTTSSADHLVGHHPAVPCAGKSDKAFAATCCLEHSLHL
jgi:hypothetical protein